LLLHVERLSDLTEKLQDYARLRGRTSVLKKTRVNLSDFLDQLTADLKDANQLGSITVHQKVPKNIEILADQDLFYRAIGNIIRNSVIYAQGSDIQIALDDQKLCISDGGKGVPKESLDKLFERFYR